MIYKAEGLGANTSVTGKGDEVDILGGTGCVTEGRSSPGVYMPQQ